MTQAASNPLIAVDVDGVTKNMPMIEVAETNTANSLVVAQYFGRRHTLQAQAAETTAKAMLKLLNAKAKQVRAHIKSITGWMKSNEHEYDYTLLNATEGIDAIVKHWAH